MLDLGTSTNFGLGASKNVSSSSSSSSAQQSQAVNTRSQAVFGLSAKYVAEQRPQQVQAQANQINPAVLARILAEEEAKRRGGGGGGFRSFNPLVFVPYSFKLMSEAIERFRQALSQALSQNFSLPAPVANAVAQVQNFVAGIVTTPFVQNLNIAINQTFSQLAQALRNPGQVAARLATNMMQLASTIASAVASGLKKVFGTKEEDRLDPDDEYFQEEETFLSRAWGIFASVGNDSNQSNSRNIKSHIDNLAKQLTGWTSDFMRRLTPRRNKFR